MIAAIPALASDYTCRESLLPEPGPTIDAYATFLRHHPSQTTTVPLFGSASTDEKLRFSLNSEISNDPSLKTASEIGLGFYQWASTFTQKNLTFHAPVQEALAPWQNLDSEYGFLKTLETKTDRPLSDPEAERRARVDTSTRFGIQGDFSSTTFSEHPEIRYYFQKRKNFYLNQETPTPTLTPSKQEDRFRYWLGKKIETLELERAENLKALVFETSETLNRPIFFEYHHQTGKNPIFTRILDFNFLSTSTAMISNVPPNEFTLELKPYSIGEREDLPFYKQMFDSTLWHIPFSRSGTAPELQNGPNQAKEYVSFLVVPETLVPMKKRINAMGLLPEQIREIRIPIEELHVFFQARISKSTYPGSLQVSSQVQARLEYELQLRNKISDLHRMKETTTMAHFGFWTSTQAGAGRKLHQTTTQVPGVLARFKDLQKPALRDPLTGLEWFGYSIHHDYWHNRDLIGTQTSTLPPFRTLRDLWDKSRNFTRTTIVLGTFAALVTGGIKTAEKAGIHLPSPTRSSSVQVGESDEAGDADEDPSDLNGDERSDTLSTVSSQRINRDPRSFAFLPRSELPSNFNHGTAVDLQNESALVDVTESIPHELYNWNALDTVTRQTIEVSSHLDQIPVDGYLFLPLPEGYDLAYVNRPENHQDQSGERTHWGGGTRKNPIHPQGKTGENRFGCDPLKRTRTRFGIRTRECAERGP